MEPTAPDVNIDRLLFCLSGLGEMSVEMTQNPNPKSNMRTILRMALGTFAISKGAIFQFTPETRQLTLLTARGLDDRPINLSLPDAAWKFFHSNDEPLDYETITKAPALIRLADANAQYMPDLPKTLWIPLMIRGQFFGLLMLSEKFDRTPYDPTEVELLMMIGRQIAVTLHNHHLHFQLSLKVLELEQLHDISLAINSSLNRNHIIKELVNQAVSLGNARRGIYMAYDDTKQEFEIAAVCNYTYWPIGKKIPLEDCWLSRVVTKATGEVFDNPMEIPAELDSFNCLAVPIVNRERVVGVLSIYDKEEGLGIGQFSDGDKQLLQALAGQAASSIENARLYELATVDGLTQLYFRRHFEMRFAEEMRRAKRYGTRLSLAMMDIDHFKKFNDTYGHSTGDEVLKLVAQTIKKSIRDEIDIPARYGGEEMLVLMPETDVDGAMKLAERIRDAIEKADLPGPNGETLHVTISIGVATMPLHAEADQALMEAADKALYKSKEGGRNRVTLAEANDVTA